ncbi:MAG: A/G-specific adenine glycosylase [Clostridia bacterium]|nr:A/G-specific adenine glycosylase [Clostridia bacterium]
METVELEKIVEPIVKWYKENKRMLPWRKQKNPYAIWISEIMLQQTRIEAVKVYYERFMREIPNIETLANIEEEVLLKLWEGLGYYSRAKNLKKAAIKICEEYGGNMPKYYEQLVDLPGIGEYTAGAIASIAYHERVPAVDGNVLRVISRIIGSTKDILLPDTKREMTAKLKAIMPKEAGDFNEGLMELGERVCIPNGEPFCNNCPLQAYCVAYKQGLTNQIPVRIKKTKRKYEERLIFVLEWKDKIAIQKRGEKGLLAGMYEFPNVMKKEGLIIKQILQTWNLEAEQKEALGKAKHIFSHIEWNMEGWRIKVKNKNEQFIWAKKEEIIEKYAIPEAFGYYKNKL